MCTDYLKYLPEEHPDVVNTKGIGMLMAHCVVKLTLVSYTAALAVISETALHMNSTIVDLVNLIATLLLHVHRH